jgi:hypothetical protein
MSPLVRRLIAKKFFIVVSCTLTLFVSTTLALAQHSVGHPTAGAVHTYAPPISHVPISSPPIIHTPMIHAPMIHAPTIRAPMIYSPSSLRIPVAPLAGPLGRAGSYLPRRPIHRFPPVLIIFESPAFLGGPFWGLNSCWWATCDSFWSWPLGSTTVSSPGLTNYISQTYETTVNVYGEERSDLPQLFLKDGTILNVTDYWLVDGQLHFTMIEGNSAKPAEQVIPFDALDLQATVDANTRRGFHFMLRNEPLEQYLRDHPDAPPSTVTPPS